MQAFINVIHMKVRWAGSRLPAQAPVHASPCVSPRARARKPDIHPPAAALQAGEVKTVAEAQAPVALASMEEITNNVLEMANLVRASWDGWGWDATVAW